MKKFTILLSIISVVIITVIITQALKFDRKEFNINTNVLESGDLLFVRGSTWESQIVLLSSTDNEFSHVGLVWKHNNDVSIIHAVPKSSSKQDEGGVLISTLDQFTTGVTNIAAYRYKNKSKELADKVINIATNYATDSTAFDYSFDLETDTKIYCTELIWVAYHRTGAKLFEKDIKYDEILMPLELSKSQKFFKVENILNSKTL